jgi:hypothetical protein
MPIRNGAVYCVNHPNRQMGRNEGFGAITSVEKTVGGLAFNPASGIPVVSFFCNECGYIELYAAARTPFWNLNEP